MIIKMNDFLAQMPENVGHFREQLPEQHFIGSRVKGRQCLLREFYFTD